MKHSKNIMVLGLILASLIFISSLYVYAEKPATINQYNNNGNQIQNLVTINKKVQPKTQNEFNWRKHKGIGIPLIDDKVSLEQYDEEKLTTYIEAYSELDEAEKLEKQSIWVLWTKGRGWNLDTIPKTTDEAYQPSNQIGLLITAKPVFDTGDGILFEVKRGTIGYNGERYTLSGFGWLRKDDGVFFMKLEGEDEDVEIKIVGKIFGYPNTSSYSTRRWIYQVILVGKMSKDGEPLCVFVMKGRVFRLCFVSNNKTEDIIESVTGYISG